jgi:phosphoribosylformimino-5-aminoimidazole carboxamide ribotide isomerase
VKLFPSIDLRNGKCVRLHQGDFDAETVYGDDPVQVARDFDSAGASWIHVVDLDAARTGEGTNLGVIEAICAAVSCRVQTGGGVRSVEAAGERLRAGVARVVVGTAAIEQPDLVGELCATHPGHVVVGLDARGREVATRGWAEGTGLDLLEAVARFDDLAGLAALVVTSIAHDATMTGPDLDQLGLVLDATAVPLVASGGVGTLDDLAALAAYERSGRGLAGAIVGKAFYERRFTVAEALTVAGGEAEAWPKAGTP